MDAFDTLELDPSLIRITKKLIAISIFNSLIMYTYSYMYIGAKETIMHRQRDPQNHLIQPV